jgi:hypothetical protein
MKTTLNKKTEMEVIIPDGFYTNYNSIVKIKGEKWMAVTYCLDEIMHVCLTSRIEIGDSTSFQIQDQGLGVATETEFREALQMVSLQIDKIL